MSTPSADAVQTAVFSLFKIVHDESAERRDRLTALMALLDTAARGGLGSAEAMALLGMAGAMEASNDRA